MEQVNNVAEQISIGFTAIDAGKEEAKELQSYVAKVAGNAEIVNQQSDQVDRSVRYMKERYASIMEEILLVAGGTEQNMAAAEEILAGLEAQDNKIHEIVQHYQDLDRLIVTLSNN